MSSRLSHQVIPTVYDLYLDIDLPNFKFNGKTSIFCEVQTACDTIILNSKDLLHHNISVIQNNKDCYLNSISEQNELLQIHTTGLLPGECTISIVYSGEISSSLEGFYRSKYIHNGVEKYMATTQFEAASARSAFPCFDEPDFKAIFKITINGPTDKTILSNMSVLSTFVNPDIPDKTIVTFNPTPKMSTYLVAFIIADLEYVETISANGTVLRVYATPDNHNKISFALDIAKKALDWYNKWFGIDYEIPKMDLVAIPDFDAGAMENWGLITFREECLLCDAHTTLAEKQDIVNVICHEIAHQWFGNLVTMEWWTYLWLNESMATYFAWLVTDELFPEWKIWDRFVRDENARALGLDSLENSHPLEVPVNGVHEIQQIFDAISYSKGACLIRFLVNYIGMETFQKGMQNYITKYKYQNAVSNDLWNSFGSGILELMDCWTHQTGYPVLDVSITETIDDSQTGTDSFFAVNYTCTISQTRYFKNPPAIKDSTIWKIPIEISFENTTSSYTVMLNEQIQTFVFADKPRVINSNRCGFYRVQYKTVPDYSKFTMTELNHTLSDICCFSMAGYITFNTAFSMLKHMSQYVSDEKYDYYFWTTLTTYINNIYDLFDCDKSLQSDFVNNIVLPVYNNLVILYQKLGWCEVESELPNDTLMRTLAINNLCRYGLGPLEHLMSEFRNGNWKSKRDDILPIVGRYCTFDDYTKLLEILRTTQDQQLISTLLGSISKAKNTEMIEHNIQLINSGEIRDHNLRYFVNCLSYNSASRMKIWEYVTTNWDKIIVLYPAGSSGLCSMVKVMASGFSTRSELDMYKKFFEIPPAGTEMSIRQTVENIINRICTIDRLMLVDYSMF